MIYLRTDDNPPTHSYKQIYGTMLSELKFIEELL